MTHQISAGLSSREELANIITHGIGVALSLVGMVILLMGAWEYQAMWPLLSFVIYGSSLVALYLASTLYHSFRKPALRQRFKIIDHAAIYLLIAGTYTPILTINMRGTSGWILFAIIWLLALAGIVFKIFHVGKFRRTSTAIYLLMGWLCVISIQDMLATILPGGIMLLVGGGAAYSFGVVFYLWDRLSYNHAIWHLFVLAGSILHFFAILFYVLPAI